MDGLTSQTAIEEFLKQGVHTRIVRRASWPIDSVLIADGEGVLRTHPTGDTSELSDEDLAAEDWTLDEGEFL